MVGQDMKAAFLATILVACGPVHPSPVTVVRRDLGTAHYPYGSKAFSQFVADSYAYSPDTASFDAWLASANRAHPFPDQGNRDLTTYLKFKANEFKKISNPSERAKAETEFGGDVWKLIKKTITKFSLDRGYEFTSVVRTGERQCLLQSVLVSGLLQAAGVNAGTAMVFRNISGDESNCGHVVAVLRRSDSKDILVDCSDPEPFVEQQGLLMGDRTLSTYRFLRPQYAPDHTILGYRPDTGGPTVTPDKISPLSTNYLRSQFEYYRGERAPNGFIQGAAATPDGLRDSLGHLEKAKTYCPDNALAMYVYGRVLWKLGQKAAATTALKSAYDLYRQYGHVPDGMLEMAKTAGLATAP
jgi:hypothetical protein